VAGQNAHSEVGDGGLARAGSGGFATGEIDSVAMVDDGAWALSLQRGIAIARVGLAQTKQEGIAAAHTQPSQDGGASGIAIAGPSGIAIAFEPGVVVCAGPGGALVGFWYDKAGAHLELYRVGSGGPHLPNTFYRFEGGTFVKLTAAELAEARDKIERWRKPWITAGRKRGRVAKASTNAGQRNATRKTGATAKE
jgi:hypothetical protein